MSESKNTELEYVDVTIGTQKLRTTKAMADRFAKQIAKQPAYQQQFYNRLEFVDTQVPQEVGLDNV